MKTDFNAIYGRLARLESSKEKADAFAAVFAAERQCEKAHKKHIEKTRMLCQVCSSSLSSSYMKESLELANDLSRLQE